MPSQRCSEEEILERCPNEVGKILMMLGTLLCENWITIADKKYVITVVGIGRAENLKIRSYSLNARVKADSKYILSRRCNDLKLVDNGMIMSNRDQYPNTLLGEDKFGRLVELKTPAKSYWIEESMQYLIDENLTGKDLKSFVPIFRLSLLRESIITTWRKTKEGCPQQIDHTAPWRETRMDICGSFWIWTWKRPIVR
ncbi:MAG: hypothetical protein Ta2E_09680 [Mycoplasmoidaceae bacterium]|nr:MAG: hypothetical protein Ta2E_09680 [Mycoplasmoidaceae bacterium]